MYYCFDNATFTPSATRIAPIVRSTICAIEKNFSLIYVCDNSVATKLNHIIVATIISTPYTICIPTGVVGLMTCVNSARKNKVAFGFNTLVKKPVRSAANEDISFSCTNGAEDSVGDCFFDFND